MRAPGLALILSMMSCDQNPIVDIIDLDKQNPKAADDIHAFVRERRSQISACVNPVRSEVALSTDPLSGKLHVVLHGIAGARGRPLTLGSAAVPAKFGEQVRQCIVAALTAPTDVMATEEYRFNVRYHLCIVPEGPPSTQESK